jgi:hypothetical protein
MSILTTLLPGLRHLRTPLAASLVRLFAGWPAFAPAIPDPAVATGVILVRGQAEDVQARYKVVDRARDRRQDGDVAADEAVVEVFHHRPRSGRQLMIHD